MAWISVHEQVIGSKLRSLAKEMGCSQNEALGLLVRLWLWGINNADKEGRIVGAEKEDIAEVLSVGLYPQVSAEKAVDALVETNWIDIENGIYIHDWEEWQEQWYKAIEMREKAAIRKRAERARKRNGIPKPRNEPETGTEKKTQLDLPTPKLIIPPGVDGKLLVDEKPKKESKEDYPEDFKQFWEAYPRKVGKGDAYKKWKTRIKKWKPEQLIEAAKKYASKVIRERTETMYIKHPSTFLSDTEPFRDFLPAQIEEQSVVGNEDEDNPYADWS